MKLTSIVYVLLALTVAPVFASHDIFSTTDHVFGTAERRVGVYTTRKNNTCLSDEGPCFYGVKRVAEEYLDAYHATLGMPSLNETNGSRRLESGPRVRRRRLGDWMVWYAFGFGRRRLEAAPTPKIDLGLLANFSIVSLDGSTKFKWQNSDTGVGWAGDVFVAKEGNTEDTQDLLFGDKIYTDGAELNPNFEKLNKIKLDKNLDHDMVEFKYDETDLKAALQADFDALVADIMSLDATPGFGLAVPEQFFVPGAVDFTNGIAETIVVDIKTDKVEHGNSIYVGGDAEDIIIFRWDKDHSCVAKGKCEGKVEIKDGGAIIPQGDLSVANFIHLAEHIEASSSDDPPPSELLNKGWGRPTHRDGTPLANAVPFGGGYYPGYWCLTGDQVKAKNVNIIGAIYTNSPQVEIVKTAGMSVEPHPWVVALVDEECYRSVGVAADATLTMDMEAQLAEEFGTNLEGVKLAIQEKVPCNM